MDGWTDEKMHACQMDGLTDGRTDRLTDGWMNRYILVRWTDGQTNGQTDIEIYLWTK